MHKQNNSNKHILKTHYLTINFICLVAALEKRKNDFFYPFIKKIINFINEFMLHGI